MLRFQDNHTTAVENFEDFTFLAMDCFKFQIAQRVNLPLKLLRPADSPGFYMISPWSSSCGSRMIKSHNNQMVSCCIVLQIYAKHNPGLSKNNS
ncbi:MAG: hypothetical protein LBQ71_21440 [Hungatella sp.]|jgi:hypothetical protein|nr:hypothetical protein [Hungatella sp.]